MSLFSNESPTLSSLATANGQKIQSVDHILVNLSSASVNANVFIAGGDAYKVVGVREVHGVVGGTGATVNLEVIPSGTANGSGTATVLTAALDLHGAVANTPQTGTLGTGTLVPSGSRLGIVMAGTLTGLADGLLEISISRA